MPLRHFRIRTLMIVVAMAGCATAGIIEYRRLAAISRWRQARVMYYAGSKSTEQEFAAAWREQASFNAHQAAEARAGRGEFSKADPYLLKGAVSVFEHHAKQCESLAAHDTAKADYYASMEAKYRRAARRPWLPVAPDPPEPK